MKKCKLILLCSCLLLILLFHLRTKSIHSKYHGGESEVTGILWDYQIDGNHLKAEIYGKEKILLNYYFETEEEKLEFSFNYHLGDTLRIEGQFQQPSGNRNFHLFNYQKYLKGKKIFWIIQGDQIEITKTNSNRWFYWKEKLYQMVSKNENADYILYLLLGDSQLMDPDFTEGAQFLGISHLFAVSGMHIHLLTGAILWFLKKVTKKQWLHFIVFTYFLIFYSFLTNFSPSIMRASIFFILLFLKNIFCKQMPSIFVLFVICCGMLLYYPFYFHNLGFVFSFLISFSLLYFSKYQSKQSYFKSLWQTSFLSFMVSIPILLKNFFTINFLTLFWNLIFVPYVSFIIFPLCILCLFLPFLNPILKLGACVLEKLITLGNQLDFLKFSFHTISIPVFWFYFALTYWCLVSYFQKKYKPFIVLFIIFVLHYNIAYYNPYPSFTMIDVGQGDSILIVLPHQQGNILIDTGGKTDYSKESWKVKKKQYSIGESILIPYLRSIGIHHLDYLILTHGDADHMGEAVNLVEKFKVDNVIFNCGEFNELEQKLINVLENKKISYYSCIKELNIDDNKLYFLNNELYDNENDNSSVIYTELNNHKFLFMGDAGVKVEEDLIKKYNLQDIDVLKVGHHGSKTSSSIEFIDEINPKYSIISVGKNNRYGHPNDGVLANLEDSKIYRTDQDGSIMFKFKNNKLQIETCTP